MISAPDQQQNNFDTLFRLMPIPRFIVRKAAQGWYRVEHMNDKALEYFDMTRERVEGHNLHDFMASDAAAHFEQSFEVAFDKKRSATIQALPGVPGAVRVSAFFISPHFDEDDNVLFLDVLAQVETADQSALQRERDDALLLLTSIFDVSEIGIIVTNHEGRIVRVNDSFVRTYGWTKSELINIDVVSLVTPDERDVARKNHEEFIRSGGRSTGELKIIRKDGSIANSLFTTATMELSQRRRFQVTTMMDITLRKKMEESLRQAKEEADTANRAKSTFLANMSHELRTPLNAIIGFTEMIIKETFGAVGHEKYKEYLVDVHSSAQHLLEIINEVLDMSKIEAQRIELDEHDVGIQGMLDDVVRMLASRAFGSKIELKVDTQGELPNIFADPRLIRQALINLISNAVKFSKEGQNVDIIAQLLDDGSLSVIIKDYGHGIAKDKIQQALEPFGQVTERAENSDERGTGLGLPLAKAMIELHEGSLTLESELGKGTSAIIILPPHRVLAKSPSDDPSKTEGADKEKLAGSR